MSMKFITQKPINLIKNLILFALLLMLSFYAWSDASGIKSLKTSTLTLSSGKKIQLFFAVNDDEQLRGLSGVLADEFADNQALLFLYPKEDTRRFWMPDTYFNLDIFFLDSQGKVKSISRNMMSHPGTTEILIPIARTTAIICKDVLEMKSSSPYSKSIKVGDKLRWTLPSSLPETKSGTHRKQ